MLIIKVYNDGIPKEIKIECNKTSIALQISEAFEKVMSLTRHNSVNGPVCHSKGCDNLFNEMAFVYRHDRVFKADPKEILVIDNRHVASYDYYTGISIAKELDLEQNTCLYNTTFIVSCGDVSFIVDENELPHITRRHI